MTVAELISKLALFPKDATVITVDTDDSTYGKIAKVEFYPDCNTVEIED